MSNISSVYRDSSGRIAGWTENGRDVTVSYDSSGLITAVLAKRTGYNTQVCEFQYSSGAFVGTRGDFSSPMIDGMIAAQVNGLMSAAKNPTTGVTTLSVGAQQFVAVPSDGNYPTQVVCPTNATTTVNGINAGIDDILGKLNVVVNTPGATATLSVQDGTTGTTYVLNPAGGYSAAGNVEVRVGWTSTVGAWRVICGAGLSAVASMV